MEQDDVLPGGGEGVKGCGSEVLWTSGCVGSMDWKKRRMYLCHEFEELEY
jgi:hypothetical protein